MSANRAYPLIPEVSYPPNFYVGGSCAEPTRAVKKLDVLGVLAIAYVALLPAQVEISQDLRIAPSDFFLILAALFLPFSFRLRKRAWSWWHLLLLLVFTMASMVRVLYAGELTTYAFLNRDLGLLVLFLSYAVITSEARNWFRMRRLVRTFVISIVLQNLVGIVAAVAAYRYNVDSVFMLDRARLCGMLVDPNAYGGLLVCAFVLCETGARSKAPLFRPPFVFFARATLGIGLALTFSRTAWFAFAIALLGLSITNFRRALPAVLTVATGAVGLAIFLGSRFLPLFQSLATRDNGGRVDLVEDALDMFGKHPYLGAGIMSFQAHEQSIVHATAVWFLADFGLVGFTVYAGFIGWFLLTGIHAYRIAPLQERSVVLGLVLAHMAMLGLSFGIDAFYQRHWWLMFALIGASNSIVKAARRPRVLIPVLVS